MQQQIIGEIEKGSSDETVAHSGLKIRCPVGRVGSTPT